VQYLGVNAARDVLLRNIGSEPLHVDSLFTTGAFTVATPGGFVLARGESRSIALVFAPAADGPHGGELLIKSDFRSHPSFQIELLGLARQLPIVGVAPDGFHVTLATGEETSLPIAVSNDGDSLLNWSLRIVAAEDGVRNERQVQGVVSSGLSTFVVERPDEWTPLDGPSSAPPTDLSRKRLLEVCPPFECCCVGIVFYDLQQQGLGAIWGSPAIPASLDGFDIVYVLDTGVVDVSNAPALREWVRGGGVLIVDGYQRVAEFNELLSDSQIRLTSKRFTGNETQRVFPHRTTANIDYVSFDRPLRLEVGYPARVLMRDSEGYPLMAAQSVGAGMVVVVPYYAFGNFYVKGSFNDNRRFANQLFHWLFSSVRWLGTADWKGTVEGRQTTATSVRFDADDLSAGIYSCAIRLRSNDPSTPVISLPVTLAVNAAAEVFIEKESVDFGSLFVGASAQRTIDVWNLGSADLTLSPFEFSAPEFDVEAPSYLVPPGGVGKPRLSASPSAEGVVQGSVEIETNDPRGAVTVGLQAKGLPTPSARISNWPIADVLEDGQRAVHAIDIANQGNSTLQWSIDVDGGTDIHTLVGVRILFAGEADLESVRVALANMGAEVRRYAGTLTPELLLEHDVLVMSDAPSDTDALVAWVQGGGSVFLDIDTDSEVDAANDLLSRFGDYASYDLQPYFDDWALVINADSLTAAGVDSLYSPPNGVAVFGRSPFTNLTRSLDPYFYWSVATRGEWGRGRVVALAGRLAADEAMSKQDADNRRFITNLIEWLAPQPRWMRMFPRYGSVEPGATQRVDVTFAPVGHPGRRQSVVTVNTNDPLRPHSSQAVTVDVDPSPVARVQPIELTFGDVARGTSASRSVAVFNEGSDDLTVFRIDVSDPTFDVDTPPFSLRPGERHEIAVSFHPTSTGETTGRLELQTNAPNAPVIRLPVSGNGESVPSIQVESPPLAFEGMVGQTFAQSIALRNTGDGELRFDARASMTGGERPNGEIRLLFDSRLYDMRSSDHASILLSDLAAAGFIVTENHDTLTTVRLAPYDVLWLQGDVTDWNGPEERLAVRD
jgi:hypothetical protein